MNLSPDAILLGLRLLDQADVPPTVLAGLWRKVAEGDVPDQLVALEEQVLARFPTLAGRVSVLAAETSFIPVDCAGCRARFRVRAEELSPTAICPLCGEAIMGAAPLMLLGDEALGALRAAERAAPYALGRARERFAHFDLLEVLGRGGAGKVYRAHNRRTGRTVALKLLDFRPLEPAAGSFKRLRQEARAAAAVTHPNIVHVFDLGVAEGVPYIEMELVQGASLGDRVARDGPLRPAQACAVCLQALAGLGAVHAARIVHGDVKPGNILIDAAGVARLTDFGVSKFLEETTSLTTADKVVGSPHFMAPEQWRGEPLTARTDVYAMGLVLYFALTGPLPYEQESRVALMYKHLHEPLIAPGQVVLLAPDYLAEVIRRATDKLPEGRFESAEEFAEALRWFQTGPAPGHKN